MKQELCKPTELQRFDELINQLKEYAFEVKYGMGALETPAVKTGKKSWRLAYIYLKNRNRYTAPAYIN